MTIRIRINREYDIQLDDEQADRLREAIEANDEDPNDVEVLLDALDPDYDYWMTDEEAWFA